jgi:hypothetical protein
MGDTGGAGQPEKALEEVVVILDEDTLLRLTYPLRCRGY